MKTKKSAVFCWFTIMVIVLMGCQAETPVSKPPTSQISESTITDVRVTTAPIPEKRLAETEEITLPNCGGSGELSQSLATQASVARQMTVSGKATANGGVEVTIPTSAKLKLGVAVERAYQQAYETANSRLDSIIMRAAPGTHIVYVVQWEERDFSSIVTYEMDGQVFEAPYEYILRVPKISGSYPTDCPTPTPSPATTSVPPTATPTPAPPTDTPTPVPPTPTPVPPTPTRQLATPTPALGIGSTLVRERDGMEMVYVPGGTFEMGRDDGFDREQPAHTVTLDSFWIDKTEVTNAQFARFVQATDYRTDAEKRGTGWIYRDSRWSEVDGADWQHPNGPETSISDRMDHPVVQVSWNDATTYCQWTGGRLLTEAEWEYAARGPDGYYYPWGDTFDDTRVNICDTNCPAADDWKETGFDDGHEMTAPVGSLPTGASWVGAMDISGNVIEWVHDWYDSDYYAGSPPLNPKGPETGETKVVRGGSWILSIYEASATWRRHNHPAKGYDDQGFRCVVELGS